MDNYNKKNSIFIDNDYQIMLFEPYIEENILPIVVAFKYLFSKFNLPVLKGESKANTSKGGHPPLDYLGCIKLYFYMVWRGISYREIRIENFHGSMARFLYGDGKAFPKKTSISKIVKFIDLHIDEIFNEINRVIETEEEIQMDKTILYCDGFVLHAHNSRNKYVSDLRVKISLANNNKKLENPNITAEERQTAEKKLAVSNERSQKLINLGRSSYGLTDNDSISIKDKTGGYVVGYNVQFVEESKYGFIVKAFASNGAVDLIAFRKMLPSFMLEFKPQYLVVDTGYDGEDIRKLTIENGTLIVSHSKKSRRTNDGIITELSFDLSDDESELLCPKGKKLARTKVSKTAFWYDTRFVCKDCNGCVIKDNCCHKKKNKIVTFRLEDFKNLKRIKSFIESEEGESIYKKRSNICESPHGYIIHTLRGKKLKRNGLIAANTIAKIMAIGYNAIRFNTIYKQIKKSEATQK
jgi:hypothetical protein